MAGPIRLSYNHLDSKKLVNAQNETARHVWRGLLKTRAFLIADKVGAGKSYIALSVAFGLWRKKRKRRSPFRILVLAGPSELSRAWLDKLCGDQPSGRAGLQSGTITGEEEAIATSGLLSRFVRIPGKGSYHETYLRDELPQSTPELYVYSLRYRRDAALLNELLNESLEGANAGPWKKARPQGATTKGRVEVLVTSPRWIAHLKNKGATKIWSRWCRSVDVIIADEIFAAKTPHTNYGSLLRRRNPASKSSPWAFRKSPPWLLGLSATVLARDVSDLRSLLALLREWDSSPKSDDLIKTATAKFVHSLRGLQRPDLDSQSSTAAYENAKAYKDAKRTLESLCRPYVVRTLATVARKYEVHAARLADASPLTADDARVPVEWPSDAGMEQILKRLQDCLPTAQATPGHKELIDAFAWLITTASEKRDFRHRTIFVESYPNKEVVPGPTHPKISALHKWVRDFYLNAESDWLNNNSNTFCFKLLIYVKHVATARELRPRDKEKINHGIQKELQGLMLNTMKKIAQAKENEDLFPNHRLATLCPALQNNLSELNVRSLADLSKHNCTGVLAALVNAHKGRTTQEKLERFRETLAHIVPQDARFDVYSRYIRVLSRYKSLRRAILKKLDGGSIIIAQEQSLKKQKDRPTLMVLDPTRLGPQLQHLKQQIVELLNTQAGNAFHRLEQLSLRKAPDELANSISSARDAISGLIKSDRKWQQHITRWSRNPGESLDHLKHRSERHHRTPGIVAVQTGADSGTRDHVMAEFRSVGNPFVLVLTNIGTVGIDLHTYCWDVLHYTPAWTPHEAEQKTGRIDRPRKGNELKKLQIGTGARAQHVRVHYLIWPFTIDERIISRLNLRCFYADRLLGSKRLDESNANIGKHAHNYRPLNLSPGFADDHVFDSRLSGLRRR